MAKNGISVSFEDQTLECTLTVDERNEKGQELAKLMAELESLEDRKKQAADSIKSLISSAEVNARAIAHIVRQGFEMRQVRCRRILNYNEKTTQVVREDTGEVFISRAANQEELRKYEYEAQSKLPFPPVEEPEEDRCDDDTVDSLAGPEADEEVEADQAEPTTDKKGKKVTQ